MTEETPLIIRDPEEYRRRLNEAARRAGEHLSSVAKRMEQNAAEALRRFGDSLNGALFRGMKLNPRDEWHHVQHLHRHWEWEDAGFPGWNWDLGEPPRIRRDAIERWGFKNHEPHRSKD